jgi:hypothetical protein
MNPSPADVLLRISRKVMPAHRRDWAKAMQAESACLSGTAATRWAVGCLIAAIKARLSVMQFGTLRIPRWVMFVEVIGSFLPLSVGWYAVAFGQPGVLRHPLNLVEQTYNSVPGGPYIMAMLFSSIVVWLLGPLGLVLGLRYVFTGRGLRSRVLGYALIGVPLAYVVLGIIGGYLAGPPDFAPPAWSLAVAFMLLPLACVAHLMYLGKPAAPVINTGLAPG